MMHCRGFAAARWGTLAAAERIFAIGVAALVIQVVVEAVAVGSVGWLLAAAAAPGVAFALLTLFIHGGRAAQTLLAGAVGLLTAAIGAAVYVARVAVGTSDASDYTGILVAAVGLTLIGLAYRTALHGRRRRVKLLAIPVTLVLLQWYAVPVMQAAMIANSPRPAVAAASSLGLPGATDVTFPASDGVRLAGWYVPGRNHAAVILMHGSHGDRADTTRHLRMLAGAGYAVLAFDARGHGQSGGQTNALGWQGSADVAGAYDFLRRQPGVDAPRIGALGLSMGAEEALRAAGEGAGLRAVVADGAGASTAGDTRLVDDAPLPASVTWTSMRAAELFSGVTEPRPLADVVSAIHVPVLLIASNRTHELALNRIFRTRIGGNADLWYVPDAGHTHALERHPRLYAAHVLALFERTVGPQRSR